MRLSINKIHHEAFYTLLVLMHCEQIRVSILTSTLTSQPHLALTLIIPPIKGESMSLSIYHHNFHDILWI